MNEDEIVEMFPELKDVGTVHEERVRTLRRAANKLHHVDSELSLQLRDIAEAICVEHFGWNPRRSGASKDTAPLGKRE